MSRGAATRSTSIATNRAWPARWSATFADGQSHSSEEVATTRAGEHKEVLVVTAPVRNANGEVDLVIEMSTDISETKRLQSQLAALGMMVGQIAHDIKGVLTGLDGGVYMVTTGMGRNDRGRLEQGWEMVRRNVDRVRTLVLDILYYAKERELEYRLASPIRIVEDLVAAVQGRARDGGVEVVADLDPAAIAFEVDVRAVEAMLTNLLNNALDACRADPSGEAHRVKVGVREADDDDHVRGGGQRHRDGPRDEGTGLHAVLLLQGRQGHRARSLHRPPHCRPARRTHRPGFATRRRDDLHRPPAQGSDERGVAPVDERSPDVQALFRVGIVRRRSRV